MKNRRSRKNAPCPDRNLFEKSFLDEMGRDELDRFLEHVSQCPRCRKTFEVMTAVKAEIDSRQADIPEKVSPAEAHEWRKIAGDRLATLEHGRQNAAPRRSRRGIFILRPIPALASLLVVLAVVGYLLILNPSLRKDNLRFSDAGGLRLISPIGRISGAPSTFRWIPVRGCKKYSFKLIAENLTGIYHGDVSCPKTELELPESAKRQLQRGMNYVWTVKAFDDRLLQLESKTAFFIID